MTIVNENMNLLQVSKLPGVSDLPIKVRGPFAAALIAEAKGDHDAAEEKLAKAVAAEEAL